MAEPSNTSVMDLDFSADLLKESIKGSMHNRGTVNNTTATDLMQIIEETPNGSKSNSKLFSVAKHSSLNHSIASIDNLDDQQTLDGQLSSAPSSNPQMAGAASELDQKLGIAKGKES